MVESTAYATGNSPNKENVDTTNNGSSSNVKSLLNSDPVSASDNNSTTVIKQELSLRSQIMEEFGINNDTISEKDNIDTDSLNTLVQIRLIKERKHIESMRKDNITMLNEIVDKCISSDKFDESNISKLLDIILDKQSAATKIINKINKQDTLMSPMSKKRRIGQSPRVSTTRQFDYRTGNNDLHSINEKDSTNQYDTEQFQSVAQSYKLPAPPPSGTATSAQSQNAAISTTTSGQSWQSQYPNPALQPPYMYQANPNIPPGSLAPPTHMMNDPYYQQQAMMAQQGYDTQMGKQYLEPPQFIQNYPPGYYPPHGRIMQGINEHGYSNIPQQQQQHSPYRNNISTVGSGPPGRKGHRRTQSAIVSMPNELKSPSRAAPQRPVNFLIHTPKHPPPT